MKVTIVTQAYNTKKYIEQCVESVLGQTHTELEYILIDNGCFDGTENIIKNYAEKDSRIKTLRFEKNEVKTRWYEPFCELATGEYFVSLDSDDWLEPDFIERLLDIAESTCSDIVATGSVMHISGTDRISRREIEERLLIEGSGFAGLYPIYHVFFRTMWGKLIRTDLLRSTEWKISEGEKNDIRYGMDTIQSFSWLRHCKRICVDNSCLHHYRINQKSVSHNYYSSQLYSDRYLFNDAIDFLSAFGPVSENNLHFLYLVYANAVYDTAVNIDNSNLSPKEKMHEYADILTNKLTINAYSLDYDDAERSKLNLMIFTFRCALLLEDENEDFDSIVRAQLPACGSVVSIKTLGLFKLEDGLINPLIRDDREKLVIKLSELIAGRKYTKQYDLADMLLKLSQDKPILRDIDDIRFLRRHGDIYLSVWQGKYADALDMATDILLGKKPAGETLIQLYMTLAALLDRADEFIFGKIKLAAFYAGEKRFDDCRTVLCEIAEMGVEDNEELSAIKSRINDNN